MIYKAKLQLQFILFTTIPIAIGSLSYLFGISWFPLLNLTEDHALLVYVMTLSVGKIGIGIIITILSLVTLGRWSHNLRRDAIFFVCLFSSLGIALITKTVIKETVREARPHIIWMAQEGKIPEVKNFYNKSTPNRKELLEEGLEEVSDDKIPYWLKNHWSQKVNFSFPSGHSIAAITLVTFFVPLLLYRRKPQWAIYLLILWGIIVCYSRLLLGLHWPQDILASAVLGTIFGTVGGNCFIWWDSKWVAGSHLE